MRNIDGSIYRCQMIVLLRHRQEPVQKEAFPLASFLKENINNKQKQKQKHMKDMNYRADKRKNDQKETLMRSDKQCNLSREQVEACCGAVELSV